MDNAQEQSLPPTTVYTCPMHPEIKRDSPGMCPECGMSLVKVKGNQKINKPKSNHQELHRHEGHSLPQFLRKFWVSLILSLPIIAYSDLLRETLGLTLPEFPYLRFVLITLSTIVFFYGGFVFLTGALRELEARLPGMMTLIALAITTAYTYSLWADFSGSGHPLYWELTSLITIMLLGHYLEMRAVQGAQGALQELSKLLPDQAELISGGSAKMVALSELKIGDLVRVRPGGRIPADGQVIEGESVVNEALVTGESRPIAKATGAPLIAGTINGDGSLKIEITKIGEQTFLAGVMRLVAEAQSSKSKTQILADRAAYYLTLTAIGTGSLTLVIWVLAGAGLAFAVERFVAVLIIACPHALGLAIPLVASIATTKAARQGFLIRQRLALETAREIDMVLFDKTGTLTKGEFGVTEVLHNPRFKTSPQEVLQLAASVDAHSEHFIAQALVAAANKKNLVLKTVETFQRLPGLGVRGLISDESVLLGGENILERASKPLTPAMKEAISKLLSEGQTVVYLLRQSEIIGAVALADIVRSQSRPAVDTLKRMGIQTAMITGDSQPVAAWVAGQLGLDEYFANVRPEEKAAKVKLLQSRGRKVAMVGDGVNDAPALTQADIGVAIGAGTNVAIESAGIILIKNDPQDIAKIIKLSRLTYAKMRQNLFWATGYNLFALPLAAGILFPRGNNFTAGLRGRAYVTEHDRCFF